MDKRIGVVAILIEDDRESVSTVNGLLSDFSAIVIGRIGVPYRDRGVSIISLIVEGTTDDVGALTGRLGMLPGVTTRSLLLTA